LDTSPRSWRTKSLVIPIIWIHRYQVRGSVQNRGSVATRYLFRNLPSRPAGDLRASFRESDVGAVRHPDELVAWICGSAVHCFPADLAIRRILVARDHVVVGHFVDGAAMRACKGLGHFATIGLIGRDFQRHRSATLRLANACAACIILNRVARSLRTEVSMIGDMLTHNARGVGDRFNASNGRRFCKGAFGRGRMLDQPLAGRLVRMAARACDRTRSHQLRVPGNRAHGDIGRLARSRLWRANRSCCYFPLRPPERTGPVRSASCIATVIRSRASRRLSSSVGALSQ
jgi:hypothetical protein